MARNRTQKKTTPEVAAMLGVRPNTLNVNIKRGRISPAPRKDDKTGRYQWNKLDIARARKALGR